jgi:hypothetical protein
MDRAERRHRRQRKIEKAKRMLRRWKQDHKAAWWADNMAKCDCWMCNRDARWTKPEVVIDDNIDNWMAWYEESK